MKRLFLLPIIVAALASCGSKTTNPEKPNASDTTQAMMNEADIYDFDKVADFIQASDEEQKKSAKQKFLTAIDIYRNKKDPENALQAFKESLQISPSSKTYYELGNAFMDIGKPEEAISAYRMAERLNYSPLSKVLYNLACANSLLEKEDEALEYVQLAIENGYDNRTHMLKDEDLAFVRKSHRFAEVYESSYGGAATPEAALFSLFEVNFKETVAPYRITADQSQKINMDNTIAYDFERFIPEMVNSEFSRDVGDEFFYVARVNSTPDYVALIYAGAGMWSDTPPVYYYLATYDPKKGEMISHVEFAGMTEYDGYLREGYIRPDMTVEVKEYLPEWEKNPDEHGYDDNKIKSKDLMNTLTYRIDAKGKIVEAKGLIGMRE